MLAIKGRGFEVKWLELEVRGVISCLLLQAGMAFEFVSF